VDSTVARLAPFTAADSMEAVGSMVEADSTAVADAGRRRERIALADDGWHDCQPSFFSEL
jgi:hypothetical protein